MSDNINNLKLNNNKFRQGQYIPQNKDKYIGNINHIFYRSSWERKFMIMCDLSDTILKWNSEPLKIKYLNPIDNKYHNYLVDFYCEILQKDTIKKYLIEIKPKSQAELPEKYKNIKLEKLTKRQKEIYERCIKTILVNKYKWLYAEEYAQRNGIEFKLLTEAELKINRSK